MAEPRDYVGLFRCGVSTSRNYHGTETGEDLVAAVNYAGPGDPVVQDWDTEDSAAVYQIEDADTGEIVWSEEDEQAERLAHAVQQQRQALALVQRLKFERDLMSHLLRGMGRRHVDTRRELATAEELNQAHADVFGKVADERDEARAELDALKARIADIDRPVIWPTDEQLVEAFAHRLGKQHSVDRLRLLHAYPRAMLAEMVAAASDLGAEVDRLTAERDSMVRDLERALYPADAAPDRPLDTRWQHAIDDTRALADRLPQCLAERNSTFNGRVRCSYPQGHTADHHEWMSPVSGWRVCWPTAWDGLTDDEIAERQHAYFAQAAEQARARGGELNRPPEEPWKYAAWFEPPHGFDGS